MKYFEEIVLTVTMMNSNKFNIQRWDFPVLCHGISIYLNTLSPFTFFEELLNDSGGNKLQC